MDVTELIHYLNLKTQILKKYRESVKVEINKEKYILPKAGHV
jgi:hypothetical protein